jgi:hypothetical protein
MSYRFDEAAGNVPLQLRDKALAALEEAAEQGAAGPVEQPQALSFALAYLWAFAGRDRVMFDRFWQALAEPDAAVRMQAISASLAGIKRAVSITE